MKALVYTSHLYGVGGGARAAIWTARAMREFMPTTIATTMNIPAQVKEWIPNIETVGYRPGMESEYDILWNVDHFSYAKPIAKRNLANIFFPYDRNCPPPQFELFANSAYTSRYVEELWGRACEVMMFPIEINCQAVAKEPIILNVARIAAPNDHADKGHLQMLDAFRALSNMGLNWQLVFIGSLDPGHGRFLDDLMGLANGLNVKFLINADQEVVDKYYSKAAIYWHPTGIGRPQVPSAQEHFGLSPLEAQYCGCVPITFKSGGPLETIRHGYDGFHVASPQELFDLTKSVMSNLSVWSLISQRAQVSGGRWANYGAWVERVQAILENRHIPEVMPVNWLDNKTYGPKDVTVVIPVHNQYVYTERLVGKLLLSYPEIKIVVVDNASTDNTPEIRGMLESHGSVYLRRPVNDGFAPANMAAKPYCDRALVLMLNNDIDFESDTEWLEIMLAEMGDPTIGIVGPKLLFANGKVQFGGMAFDKTREDLFYHVGYGLPDSPAYNQRQDTFAVTGACLLCRKEFFNLDLTIKMNYEDIDMCLMAQEAGARIIYQPAAHLYHFEARTKETVIKQVGEMIKDSKKRFVEKHGKSIGIAS